MCGQRPFRQRPACLEASINARLDTVRTVAVMRGDFATALDSLTEHQQERASLRKPAAVDAPVLDALGTAEVTIWVALAAKPSAERAIVERFRGLACTPPGKN